MQGRQTEDQRLKVLHQIIEDAQAFRVGGLGHVDERTNLCCLYNSLGQQLFPAEARPSSRSYPTTPEQCRPVPRPSRSLLGLLPPLLGLSTYLEADVLAAEADLELLATVLVLLGPLAVVFLHDL